MAVWVGCACTYKQVALVFAAIKACEHQLVRFSSHLVSTADPLCLLPPVVLVSLTDEARSGLRGLGFSCLFDFANLVADPRELLDFSAGNDAIALLTIAWRLAGSQNL